MKRRPGHDSTDPVGTIEVIAHATTRALTAWTPAAPAGKSRGQRAAQLDERSHPVNDDRIPYGQLSQLTDGRDQPAAHAIDNAARASTPLSHHPRDHRHDPREDRPG